jgi:hypothetical protein
MSAGLSPLRNNHVHSNLMRADRGLHRANLMQHRDARAMGGRYELRRISPKERQRRDPLGDANLNARTMGEMEDEVHAKGFVCKRAKVADLLP